MTTYKGTDGDNMLVGTAADDIFFPKLGHDTVDGAGGDDTLNVNYSTQATGGTSNIYQVAGSTFGGTLMGGSSSVDFDHIQRLNFKAGAGDDLVTVDPAAVASGGALNIDGGAGTNTLTLALGNLPDSRFIVHDNGIIGGNVGDYANFQIFNVTVAQGSNTIVTGAGDDVITSRGGTNSLSGGAGDDVIYGSGIDQVDGGAGGYDRWSGYYQDVTAALTFDDKTDKLSNGTHFKNIENYQILSGSGDDTFNISTAQTGSIDGGDGRDTLNADLRKITTVGYSGIGADGADTGFNAYLHTGGSFSIYDTEVFNVRFGSGVDLISLDASPLAHGATISLDGGGGDDQLAIDFSAVAEGTTLIEHRDHSITSNHGSYASIENFTLTGGAGADVFTAPGTLHGGGGDDILEGGIGASNDTLDGGAGTDTASYADALNRVYVSLLKQGQAQDTGHAGMDTLTGIENLTGSAFDDVLTGDAGDNVLQGGAGDDHLDGKGGINTASYADAGAGVTVSLAINGRQDMIGAGRDALFNFHNLTGSAHDDYLTGDAFRNLLDGGAGDDVLDGGASNDTLIGGAGHDLLHGGTGADTFTFTSLGDFATGSTLDTIDDFSHAEKDHIDLSKIDPDPAAAGDQSFTYIGARGFTGAGGTDYEVRAVANGAGGYTVSGDIDHDGVADFSFTVHAAVNLVASDFIL